MKPYTLTAFSTLSVFLLSAAITRGDILINEVLIDPPGSDESGNLEYIEILSTSGAAKTTDGLTLLLIDSNNGGYGKIRKRWSLDGFSTGSNGLLLIGNNYPSAQPYGGIPESTQLADPSSPDSFVSGDLGSNGGFTLFLVEGFKPNTAIDTDLDSNDDGEWDVTPWAAFVDSVGFDDTDPADPPNRQTYAWADVSQTNYFPENVSRKADDHRANTADAWFGGVIPGSGDGISFDPERTFNGFPGSGATPGRVNSMPELADLRLNEISINPNGNDENLEYIEILSVSGLSESANGYHVVLIVNDPTEGDLGTIEQAWDLSGLQTGANGLLLLGDGYAKPNANKRADTPFKTSVETATEAGDPPSMGRNEIEPSNGVSILVVTGFSGSPGSDLDGDNDGILDTQPWDGIADSVGFVNVSDVTGNVSPSYAPGRLEISDFYPDNISRVGGNTEPNTSSAFYGGDYGGDSQLSIGFNEKRFLPQGIVLTHLRATPGSRNLGPDEPLYERDILLNEILLDAPPSPGNNDDNTHEFIEIISANGRAELLEGLAILIVDTQPGSSQAGTIGQVLNLSGLSTGPNGLCIIGDSYNDILLNAPVPFDTNREDPQGLNAGDISPNEGLTVLLVEDFIGTLGQDIDPNDDGIFDAQPWTKLIDGVGFGMVVDPSVAVVTQPDYVPDTLARLPGSLASSDRTDAGAWTGGILTGQPENPAYGSSSFGPFHGGVTRGYANHSVAPAEPGSILINEIILGPENDQNRSVELLATTLDERSLSGYTLVWLDSNGGSVGEIVHLWDLSSLATGSNGLLLLGEGFGESVPFPVDPATATAAPLAMKTDDIDNPEAFSLLLVQGLRPSVNEGVDLDMSTGSTLDDDGILDLQPWSAIVDSVGFREYDADISSNVGVTYGEADLTQAYEPDAFARIASPANLRPGEAADWYGGDLNGSVDGFAFDPAKLFGIEGPASASPGFHNLGPGLGGGVTEQDMSDVDGDGRPRLLEIATGSDPVLSDKGFPLKVHLISENQSLYVDVIYPRLPGGMPGSEGEYRASGILYTVEQSHDLISWRPSSTVEIGTSAPTVDSLIELATVRANTPSLETGDDVFFRLLVTRESLAE